MDQDLFLNTSGTKSVSPAILKRPGGSEKIFRPYGHPLIGSSLELHSEMGPQDWPDRTLGSIVRGCPPNWPSRIVESGNHGLCLNRTISISGTSVRGLSPKLPGTNLDPRLEGNLPNATRYNADLNSNGRSPNWRSRNLESCSSGFFTHPSLHNIDLGSGELFLNSPHVILQSISDETSLGASDLDDERELACVTVCGSVVSRSLLKKCVGQPGRVNSPPFDGFPTTRKLPSSSGGVKVQQDGREVVKGAIAAQGSQGQVGSVQPNGRSGEVASHASLSSAQNSTAIGFSPGGTDNNSKVTPGASKTRSTSKAIISFKYPENGAEAGAAKTNARSTRSNEKTSSFAKTYPSVTGKRPFGFEEDSGDDDDDEDYRDRKKRRGSKTEPTVPDARLSFACPFNKHDPLRYCENNVTGKLYKSCSGGFKDLKCLKEHLYLRSRFHLAAVQCNDCGREFSTEEDHAKHKNIPDLCHVTVTDVPSIPTGITPEHQRKIKQDTRYAKSEEEKWKIIYGIIFPNDETIPNPYYDPVATRSFSPQHIAGFEAYERDGRVRAGMEAEIRYLRDIIRRYERRLGSEGQSQSTATQVASQTIGDLSGANVAPSTTRYDLFGIHSGGNTFNGHIETANDWFDDYLDEIGGTERGTLHPAQGHGSWISTASPGFEHLSETAPRRNHLVARRFQDPENRAGSRGFIQPRSPRQSQVQDMTFSDTANDETITSAADNVDGIFLTAERDIYPDFDFNDRDHHT